jgi:hypothetical protein
MAWLLMHWQLPAWPALSTLPLLAAVLWWRQPSAGCDLVWNGQTWTADGAPSRVEVVFDMGSWLLLRLRPEGIPAKVARWRWIPVAAADVGADFHALRVAVYGALPANPPESAPLRGGPEAGAD